MALKIEKRMEPSRRANILVPIISILLALVAGAVLLFLAGVDPLATYAAMLDGALGSSYAISETLVRATPLSLIDRIGGGAFGVLRGVVLLLVLATVVRYTPASQSLLWTTSVGAASAASRVTVGTGVGSGSSLPQAARIPMAKTATSASRP